MISKRHMRRSLRRNLWLLMVIEFFAETRFYFPVALLAFQSLLGSYTMGMSVFSVVAIAMTLADIPTGVLSDKWGRRGTLILGSLGEVFAVANYALAFTYPAHCYLFLYVGSISYGFSGALFSGNNQAMVYETLTYYRRTTEVAKVLGRISAMGQIALAIIGTLTGLLIWLGVDYRTLVLMTIAPLLMTVLLAWFLVEPPDHLVEDRNPWQHMKKAAKLLIKNQKLRLLAIATILQSGSGQANYYFTPGFVDSVWPHWLTPVYRTGQHVIGSLGFWFAGHVIKRYGALKVLLSGTFLANIVAVTAYGLASFASPFLLMLTQLSYALGTTADRTVQQENFSDAQRATMGSLISFFTGILIALSGLLMGWLSDMYSPGIAMLSVLICRASVVNWIYIRLYKKHK